MSKNSRFRGPYSRRRQKLAETLLKPEWDYLYHNYWSLWRRLSWKKPLLVILKILGLSVNSLTVDDKYSLLNRDNLRQSIQMQLSQKEQIFLNFFLHFGI